MKALGYFYKKLYTQIQEEDSIIVSVIEEYGSTPRGKGAKMFVIKNGDTIGTIGGGAVEYHAKQVALDCLTSKTSCKKHYQLNTEEVANLGMICGGNITVYFHYINQADTHSKAILKNVIHLLEEHTTSWLITCIDENEEATLALIEERRGVKQTQASETLMKKVQGALKRMPCVLEEGGMTYYIEPIVKSGKVYLFGAGHVALQVVPVLHKVAFYTVVMDEREEFANRENYPTADEVKVVDFNTVFEHLELTMQDFVVILTRGHLNDYEVLVNALRTPVGYIGMIGSRAKLGVLREKLRKDGFNQEAIDRIYSPIGIEILAQTPEEIAISIAGEMIKVRREKELEETSITR